MEGRRRQRWDNHRRSQNRRPPRGSWQSTVPSWEKEFCKVIGSINWGTLLQRKKFMHLYGNVIKWNDSAGEQAFHNAKKRYWAEINGFPCDISLPDPDLYIDKINWDSKDEPEQRPDLESKPVTPNTNESHDPIVIFGDSLVPKQSFSPACWGDAEKNLEVPTNHPSANYHRAWEQNWGNRLNNTPINAWPSYPNYTWQFSNVPMAYGGRYVWSYRTSWVPINYHWTNNHISRNYEGYHRAPYWVKQDNRSISREWSSIHSCGPVGHHSVMTIGQTWNQKKRVS